MGGISTSPNFVHPTQVKRFALYYCKGNERAYRKLLLPHSGLIFQDSYYSDRRGRDFCHNLKHLSLGTNQVLRFTFLLADQTEHKHLKPALLN